MTSSDRKCTQSVVVVTNEDHHRSHLSQNSPHIRETIMPTGSDFSVLLTGRCSEQIPIFYKQRRPFALMFVRYIDHTGYTPHHVIVDEAHTCRTSRSPGRVCDRFPVDIVWGSDQQINVLGTIRWQKCVCFVVKKRPDRIFLQLGLGRFCIFAELGLRLSRPTPARSMSFNGHLCISVYDSP